MSWDLVNWVMESKLNGQLDP